MSGPPRRMCLWPPPPDEPTGEDFSQAHPLLQPPLNRVALRRQVVDRDLNVANEISLA